MVKVVDPDTGEVYEDGQPTPTTETDEPTDPTPTTGDEPDDGSPAGGTNPDDGTGPALSPAAQAYLDAMKDYDAIKEQWPNHPKTQAIIQGANAFYNEMGFTDANGRVNREAARNYIRKVHGPNAYTQGEGYRPPNPAHKEMYQNILRKQLAGEPLTAGEQRSLSGLERTYAPYKQVWTREVRQTANQATAQAAKAAEHKAALEQKGAEERAARQEAARLNRLAIAAGYENYEAQKAAEDAAKAQAEQDALNQAALDASLAETGGNTINVQTGEYVPLDVPNEKQTPTPGTTPPPKPPVIMTGQATVGTPRFTPFKTTYNPAGPGTAQAQAPQGQAGATTRTKQLGWQPTQRRQIQFNSQQSGTSGNTSTLRWKPFAG